MGFNFGNAINAVPDVHTRECLKKLGAAVHDTSATVSTIIQENELIPPVLSGGGTSGRLAEWTGGSSLGTSNIAADDGGTTAVATLDTHLLGSTDTEFYLFAPVSPSYLVTTAGMNPGAIPIVGTGGADLIGPDQDPATGGPISTDALAYYNVGSVKTFQMIANTINWQENAGSVEFNMGDVAGSGPGNGFMRTTVGGGNVTFTILGTGSHAFTFSKTVAVPDDPYAVGWNGSANVPTKNAVYDKIESVIAGYPVGANPSQTIDLATHNGSAATFMRSDGAPALDVTIAPTWTGAHTFSNAAGVAISNTAGGIISTSAANSGTNIGLLVKNTVAQGTNRSAFEVQNSAGSTLFSISGAGASGLGTKRFRFGVDASNFLDLSVAASGSSTFSPTSATTANLTFQTTTGAVSFSAGTNMTFTAGTGTGVFQFSGGLSMLMADGLVISNIANTTGLKIGAAGDKLGFYSVAPVARPGAFTQTYSTSSATCAALTSATLTDNSGGTANTTVQALTDPADTPITADALRDDLVANIIPEIRNNFADIVAQVNALRVDIDNAKQNVTKVIDDGQSLGLLQ